MQPSAPYFDTNEFFNTIRSIEASIDKVLTDKKEDRNDCH